jgi:ParB family transcriptional regulator, chromosome partitioning protein
MGGVDLDPASCAAANETVGATRFYSLKEDGLKQPWFGRVWLNPPFGKFGPLFVRRIVEDLEAEKISQAILLLKATHLATGWFTDAMTVEHLLCCPRRRINFHSSIVKVSTATFPSVLIGLGIPRDRFEEHFGPLGKIAFVPEGA